jgi:hypothetical protein
MCSAMRRLVFVLTASLLACSGAPEGGDDAGAGEASAQADAAGDGAPIADDAGASDAPADSGTACFESAGVWGECLSLSDCAALGDSTSSPGYCPGPSDVQCCAKTPDVADDPPVPAGWKLMAQADVTPAMTSWAVSILHDPVTYPMFSTTTQTFGSLLVMARVEWHPPDFQNSAVHRGVTLYEPI